MTQATFVQEGRSLDHTPGADVAAGEVVIQGGLAGMAKVPIKAAALGALAVSGVFDVVKAQEAFASVGGKAYWDAAGDPYGGTPGTGAATATAGGNTFLGFVIKAAESTDTTVRILLVPAAAAAEAISVADLSDVGPVVYTAGALLVGDADSYEEVPVSGDVALAADGTVTIQPLAVDNAMLAGEIARTKMIEEALAVYGIPLQDLRNDDGSVLDATGGAGLFSATSGGFGTGTLTIDGEAASGNTKTDTMQFEFVLPPEYVAGGDVKLVVTAKESVGAATAATTLSAEAYESDGEGAVGADLYNAFDVTDITEAWQTCTAIITPTDLVAGDRLIVFVRIVTDDTAGSVGTIAQIGKVELQADIQG